MPFITIKPLRDYVDIRMYIIFQDKWVDPNQQIKQIEEKSIDLGKSIEASGAELVYVDVQEDALKLELIHYIIIGVVAFLFIIGIIAACTIALKQNKKIQKIENV